MKKTILIVFALLIITALNAQSQNMKQSSNYATQWLEVMKFEKQSLPKSAAQEVDKILRQAIADKNSPQVIKALIHQGKYDLALDAQNDTLIFRNLNDMLAKSTDAVEKSVLHSMLGELYLQYYQKESWLIDQRTELSGFVPDDMKEWTRNIFYDKAVQHLNASLQPRAELEKAQVSAFSAVVVLGKDSRRFFPSMYDFLARRAVNIFSYIDFNTDLGKTLAGKNIAQQSLFAPAREFAKLPFDPQPQEYGLWALETYRAYIASLLARDMNRSALLTELEKLEYLNRFYNAYQLYALPSLQKMHTQWKNQDISVEIVDKMADFYLQKINELPQQDTLLRETQTKELYDLLQKTVSQFPKYERISVIENRLSQLTQPQFAVSGGNTFAVNGAKELTVSYKNIRSLTAKLYKINSPADVMTASERNRNVPENRRTFIKNIPVTLAPKAAYEQGKTSLKLDVAAAGIYMLVFESLPQTEDTAPSPYYFSVTDLAVFSRASGENTYDFFAVNRTTGDPAKNAHINIYKLPANWHNSALELVETLPVNELGMAVYHKKIPNNDVFFHAVSGADNGAWLSRLPYSYRQFVSDNRLDATEQAHLYLDRGLYRPAQTVYFKAILTKSVMEKSEILAGKSADVILYDANRREISRQTLRSNDFGSLSGEFVLPQGALTGGFRIAVENMGDVYFRVEEYKRPTFEITFDKIEKTYKFGEEVTLKGTAENFSGIKLQNAAVSYRVTRQQAWWRRWSAPQQFAEGVATTDENGNFEITFTPEKEDNAFSRAVYTFAVEAAVTDANGETQTGSYNITVGDVSMMLNIEMPDQWEKSAEEKIAISAENLDGNNIAASGTYQIFSLSENDSIRAQALQGNFTVGEQKELKERLKKLPSAKYRIKLQSKDDRGNEITAEKDFTLFAYTDKRPPVKTNEWLVQKNTAFAPNKPAEIIFGASEKVNVLYELWQANTLLERKRFTLDNENRLFSFAAKPEYKNGITLMLTYVKDEKFYAHSVDLLPEKETKTLNVKLDVFRDKIRPAAHEEWRVSVTDAWGKPALAEVLASMYDFSLDNISATPNWWFSAGFFRGYRSDMRLDNDDSFSGEYAMGYIHVPMKNVNAFEFDRLNWFDFSLYYYGRMMMRSAAVGGAQLQSKAYAAEEIAPVAIRTEDAVANELSEPAVVVQDLSAEAPTAPQIRRNFAETAFFFPHLRTNAQGETQIAFTVPESNTRWRFRLLAHDKKLNVGQAEAFATSQKELMVTPNMPRFLRQGDRTGIAAKISNLSDGNVSGTVRIEFFNPVSDEIVSGITVENPSQPFSLAQNASSDAVWMFDVPSDMDVIGVRIIAQSESFSDGEQHALAVLPNRMLVTETLPLDVNGNQTKSFAMSRLAENASATAQNYRLTLEFASNPAWYAVQALPVLSAPDHENAVSWFAAYYATSLGAHIGKAYPKVSAMLEAWKKQGGTSETLLSNLEKNQELKSVLLEETPWVLEARTESEQKEKLALLFNLNRAQNLTRQATQKLAELQTSQGGWAWFNGFQPSVGISHYILYGFSQLSDLRAADFSAEISAMQAKAVSYIDAEAVRRFEQLKRYNKDWRKLKSVSSVDLEYLYVRAAYPQYKTDAAAKELTDFYTSVIEQNWTQFSLYERALIAVLMHRKGKSAIVQNILKSYREHATVSPEMGMFWANNRAHVFMSQSATSVHTFIMEAFRLGGASAAEMDDMKRWLLKQKQTQLWESAHATADAVYALLSTGGDWFSSEGKTTVSLGGKVVEPEKTELGTGYFKEAWTRSEIRPEMGNVTVSHSGNAPAWGALYWQYFEELDKITKTDAALDVEKLLFVERTDASGKKLVPVTENSPLQVGDKVVVRLTVRTDRDMEFVHLKDMRAACFEPVEQISATRWQGGTVYYQTSKDASTNFYFNTLPRGTYVFEYGVFVNRAGSYSNGITTIQCLYAPEFSSHTAGIRVVVGE